MAEQQVKIFVESQADSLEMEINKWLSEKPEKKIVNITFSTSQSSATRQPSQTDIMAQRSGSGGITTVMKFSVLILYQEVPAEEETDLVGPGNVEAPNIY